MSTDRKKILLTGGRAPVTLDLARKFKESGHDVYVADSIKYHLCRYSTAVKKCIILPSPAKEKDAYLIAISSAIERYKIDLLIPTCEEIFHISGGLEKIKNLTEVFADNIAILNKLHNKYTFNKMIEDSGISVPATVQIKSKKEYESLVLSGRISYPHVLKPVYSRFSSQTKFIFKPEKFKLDVSADKSWVAQSYIDGQLLCTYSICHEGSVLASIIYSNYYTSGKNKAGISFKSEENSQLHQWISAFVKNINYTGQIAFDVILAKDGSLWPIECNPRGTSGIHLFSDQQNIPEVFLRKKIIISSKNESRPMLALAMIIFGLLKVRSLKKLAEWIKCFYHGKDIVFSWKDPLAFLMQFYSVISFFKMGREKSISTLEATTSDIEWNGD